MYPTSWSLSRACFPFLYQSNRFKVSSCRLHQVDSMPMPSSPHGKSCNQKLLWHGPSLNTVASTTCGLVTVIKDAAVDALQLKLDINYVIFQYCSYPNIVAIPTGQLQSPQDNCNPHRTIKSQKKQPQIKAAKQPMKRHIICIKETFVFGEATNKHSHALAITPSSL